MLLRRELSAPSTDRLTGLRLLVQFFGANLINSRGNPPIFSTRQKPKNARLTALLCGVWSNSVPALAQIST